MSRGIYLIQSNDSLAELTEESYDSELLLQELLTKYPNLLSGDHFNDEEPHKWLLIKREMGIPDSESHGNRWALDHLFIDQEGIPTFVEVKRSNDTRIRREVVGQMLEYAANAILYWPIEKIQEEAEITALSENIDFDIYFQEFIGGEQEIIEFWQKVESNLLIGRIRLIFAADEIPKELQRIIEFLNQQMSPAEVYAIEVKQYAGQGIKALVSRTVGITADADMRKSSGRAKRKLWNTESFLEILRKRSNKREFAVAKQILNWAERKNLRIAWGTGSVDGSFYPMLDLGGISHYTFCVRTGYKNAHIQLQFAQLKKPFDNPKTRQELADKVQKATGRRFQNSELIKYPSIMLSTLTQQKLQDFLEVFDWYIEQCKSDIPLNTKINQRG